MPLFSIIEYACSCGVLDIFKEEERGKTTLKTNIVINCDAKGVNAVLLPPHELLLSRYHFSTLLSSYNFLVLATLLY